jgi:hypothetical protein
VVIQFGAKRAEYRGLHWSLHGSVRQHALANAQVGLARLQPVRGNGRELHVQRRQAAR